MDDRTALPSIERHPARTRLTVGAVVVLVLTALAVTVVIGVMRTAGSPIEDVSLAPVDATTSPVYVHVAGSVARPGLYRLREGARVVDAVAAAGGFRRRADRSAVNLARPVSDGEQLHVPREGETPAGSAGATGVSGVDGQPGDGRVNLNTADAAALETLPRIGPALAARILEWREQNGRFASIDDLTAVPGIGEKLVAGIRDKATV